MGTASRPSATGVRQFLDLEQQRAWIKGEIDLPDATDRSESLEQRFKYVARFAKLLSSPHAKDVLEILGLYGPNCIPIPRKTERFYWSVSCLPSSSDKPLIRVNASWMELFTLYAQGEDVRARFIVHLSDFTTDGSATPSLVDKPFLEQSAAEPDDVRYFFPRGADIFGINVHGSASIRQFLASRRVLHALRTFNLTHMNRGRNAYQASHCYSAADYMLSD
ncbi:hypothetical protein FZC33_06775 [Labrys sp. KNU-23]|uniref:hypothetical protein n=1 Tax=Labrys sp. KNU-23 TaxID=2789216 RepID=UPI0011EC16CA|nr:hypothetical protein [Labrys sp. KNU-23]QEN85918.1 hypothetical protein FZC33_06775 [Labrys sp. KNU-23]